MTVCPFSFQQWSRDFGRGNGGWESCCTHCCATVRRVRHTVNPRQERRHCRWAENFTEPPSSSGSWSTPRAFLLLSSSLLCHEQGFANSTAPRGRHTNQLTSSDECGQCALLHRMLWSKNTSVVFYLPVHLLLCCCCSLFTGLHTYRMCLFSELSLPPTLLGWSPHTLQLLCLSCRKRTGKETERERETPIPSFPDRVAMSWEKENVFFVWESP